MPETSGYLVLGLVVFFGILLAFVVSMGIRYLNLQKDLQLIETLRETEKQ